MLEAQFGGDPWDIFLINSEKANSMFQKRLCGNVTKVLGNMFVF